MALRFLTQEVHCKLSAIGQENPVPSTTAWEWGSPGSVAKRAVGHYLRSRLAFLGLGQDDSVFLDLLVKRTLRYPESYRRPTELTVLFLKDPLDMSLLELP